MKDSPAREDAVPTPRRWPQFNLRSLLFALFFVALMSGVYGYRFYQERRITAQQRRAVEDLVAKYGVEVQFRGPWVVFLAFPLARYDESALESLGTVFPQLERIVMIEIPLTRSALTSISQVPQLRELLLMGCPIDDSSTELIAKCEKLRKLWLSDTKISDFGIRSLAVLTHLERLDLSNTKTTDIGLKDLQALTNLKQLYLHGTRVTRAGVRDLQRTLPNCNVVTGIERP